MADRRSVNSPLTEYLCFLVRQTQTRQAAGQEARRLGINLKWAEWYWKNVRGTEK